MPMYQKILAIAMPFNLAIHSKHHSFECFVTCMSPKHMYILTPIKIEYSTYLYTLLHFHVEMTAIAALPITMVDCCVLILLHGNQLW